MEANMTIRCLIAGCTWSQGEITLMGMAREPLLCQCCKRCGSFRYLPRHRAMPGGSCHA